MTVRIHFLNVLDGDCTIIEHDTDHVTVIDVCNGNGENKSNFNYYTLWDYMSLPDKKVREGNYSMKEHPTNPIQYIRYMIKKKNIFRFILTHPDMDHMDGIENIFNEFRPINFWDTANDKDMDDFVSGKYKETDWNFYKNLRDNPPARTKVLRFYRGAHNKYFNLDDNNKPDGDGLFILSPTKQLVANIKEKSGENKWNDCSYVLLLKAYKRKIVFAGDSENLSWNSMLEDKKVEDELKNIDVLIAPHHGRKTGGDDENSYLDILNPQLTLFGNAESSKLNYAAWNFKKLSHITNNQAGNIMVEINNAGTIRVYCENEKFTDEWNNDISKVKTVYKG